MKINRTLINIILGIPSLPWPEYAPPILNLDADEEKIDGGVDSPL